MHADFTFSEQQFAAITAPLEPAVVIAGAGSGKTTVMAARVVWLVATGQVAADQVLGLTFTTKAAAELRRPDPRVAPGRRSRPPAASASTRRPARLGDRRLGREEVEEPTVATYHAYAAGLLTEHGLRIGHEPDTRLIADALALPAGRRAPSPGTTAPCSTSATARPAWSLAARRSTPSCRSTS